MNKYILITIITAVCILAFLLVFFLLSGNSEEAGSEDVSSQGRGILETAGEKSSSEKEMNPAAEVLEIEDQVTAETEEEIVSEDEVIQELAMSVVAKVVASEMVGGTLSSDSRRIFYYDFIEKEFASVNLLGRDRRTKLTTEDQAVEVVWSPDKNRVVYESITGDQIFAKLSGGEEVSLGNSISSPVFTDSSEVLAYNYSDKAAGISTVSIGNPEIGLSDYRAVVSLKGQIVVRSIPTRGKIGYYLYTGSSDQSALYTASLSREETEIIMSPSKALNVKWSPDGSHLVYNVLGANGRPELWVADGDGRNSRQINHATFIDKVVWSPDGSILYLAVPQNLPRMQNYYDGYAKTTDRLYSFDFSTGEGKLVCDLVEIANFDIRNMFITPQGYLIYFENYDNHNLMVLNLQSPLLDPKYIESTQPQNNI